MITAEDLYRRRWVPCPRPWPAGLEGGDPLMSWPDAEHGRVYDCIELEGVHYVVVKDTHENALKAWKVTDRRE